MSKHRFAKAMKYCATAVDHDVDEERIRVYYDLLKEFPIEQIEAAFYHFARTSRWFPKPADLIEFLEPAQPTVEQEAVREWDGVRRQLPNSANFNTENETTRNVVNSLGGARFLGMQTADQLVWIEKEFVKRYVDLAESGASPYHRNALLQVAAQIGRRRLQ